MAAFKTTKLQAVNEILAWVGEAEVPSLGASDDATNAENTLDRTLIEFQNRRWYFNLEKGVTLSPDVSDNIILAATVIDVLDDESNKDRRLVIKNDRLYDLISQSDTFTSDVTLDLRHSRSWDDLPEQVRWYVIYLAAGDFQMTAHGSRVLEAKLAQKLEAAEEAFLNYDARIGAAYKREANALQPTHFYRRTLGLRRPW